MKLIVGLGNPGDKYAATRHNAGFWLVERLAAQSGTILRKDGKFQALVGRHEASGAWLVLPQSYMNASGRPVQMMASFFKIQPADLLVIHDELDLPPGTARLKQGGGVAGHNGLKDVSARLASHDYWRLRLGIGRPAGGAVIDYVLHKPAQDERVAIDEAIQRSLEVLPLVFSGEMQGAMLKLHTQEAEPRRKREGSPQADRAPESVRGERPEAPAKPPRPEELQAADTIPGAQPAQKRDIAAAVEQQAAPVQRRTSSIERFGDIARAAQIRRAGEIGTAIAANTEAPARTEPSDRREETPPAATSERGEKPGKKGGLNSFLRKIIPGSGAGRKR